MTDHNDQEQYRDNEIAREIAEEASSDLLDCVDILCSCGEIARVKFDSDARTFICQTPYWKYDVDRLWNCGMDGHSQKSVCTVRTNAPLTAPDGNWASYRVASLDDINFKV